MKIDIQGAARDSEETLGEKLQRFKTFLPGIICKPAFWEQVTPIFGNFRALFFLRNFGQALY